MATFIVKAHPAQDFYVLWSTVVDAPIAWGPRAQVEAEASELNGAAAAAPERFERADERGSSGVMDPPWYGWQESSFIVRETFRGGGTYTLPREHLRAFCESLDDDGLATSASMQHVELLDDED